MKFASLFSGLLVSFSVLVGAETLRKMEQGSLEGEEAFGRGYYPPPQNYPPKTPGYYGPSYPQCSSRYFNDKKLTFEFEVTGGVVVDPMGNVQVGGNADEVGDRMIVHTDVAVLRERPSYGYNPYHRPHSYPPETGPTVGTISLVSTAVSCSESEPAECEVLLNGFIRFDDYYFCKGSLSFSAAHTFPPSPVLPTPTSTTSTTATATTAAALAPAAVPGMTMVSPDDPIYGGVTGGNKDFVGANGSFEIQFLRTQGSCGPVGPTASPTAATSSTCRAFLKIIIHPFAPSKTY